MSSVIRFKDQEDFYKQMKGTHCRINPGIVRDQAKPSAAPAKPKAPSAKVDGNRSELEITLEQQIAEAGLPKPETQYFHLRGSKHTLDFAWPAYRINGMQLGCEVQGMVHRIKGTFSADLEKRARGLLQDWWVLEVGGEQIRNGKAIEWLKQAFAKTDNAK